MKFKEIHYLFICTLLCSPAFSQNMLFIGEWSYESENIGIFPGFFNKGNEHTVLTFSKDSIEVSTGIYYYIDNPYLNNDANGRFPFVLSEKKARWLMKNDTLKFYYKPWDQWLDYSVRKATSDELILQSNNKQIRLRRHTTASCGKTNLEWENLETIRASVQNLDRFLVDYSVTIECTNLLIFKDAKFSTGTEIQLSNNFFQNLIREIECFPLAHLRDQYLADESDETEISVSFIFKNGQYFKTQFFGVSSAPPELTAALVTLIYSHQKYLYKDLKPLMIDRN